MPKPIDPFAGVFRLSTDLSLTEVWTGLHSDAQMWQRAAFAADTLRQRAAIEDNTTALLTALTACPAVRWQAFLEAQGVTQLGAVALSWCSDANISQVADLFLRDVKGLSDINTRAARRVNPALIPVTRSLREMTEIAKSDVKALVLMCLSHPSPIIFDVSNVWLNELPTVVGTIFLERYDPTVSVLDASIALKWQAAA